MAGADPTHVRLARRAFVLFTALQLPIFPVLLNTTGSDATATEEDSEGRDGGSSKQRMGGLPEYVSPLQVRPTQARTGLQPCTR